MDYVYRDKMLKHLIDSVKLHGITKNELFTLLGQPETSNNGYHYYTIAQERFGLLPIHTKTLVIKLTADSTVEWRKIHE